MGILFNIAKKSKYFEKKKNRKYQKKLAKLKLTPESYQIVFKMYSLADFFLKRILFLYKRLFSAGIRMQHMNIDFQNTQKSSFYSISIIPSIYMPSIYMPKSMLHSLDVK